MLLSVEVLGAGLDVAGMRLQPFVVPAVMP